MAPMAGAVLYVKNIAKVSTFYLNVAELAVVGFEDGYIVLESPSFQLVLVAIPEEIAVNIEISSPPTRREDTPVKLIFYVSSISVARTAALQFGGELSPMDREWTFRGHRVCDGLDPEGNVIQFREV